MTAETSGQYNILDTYQKFQDSPMYSRKARHKRPAQRGSAELDPEKIKIAAMERALDTLHIANLKLIDLLLYVSDPRWKKGMVRYSLFRKRDGILQVLNLWMSSANSAKGHEILHEWVLAYVKKVVKAEGEKVRRKGILHTKKEDITPSFAATFSLGSMYTELASVCPATTNILHAMCTTTLQEKRMTKHGKDKKDMVSVAYMPIHDCNLLCHVTRQL